LHSRKNECIALEGKGEAPRGQPSKSKKAKRVSLLARLTKKMEVENDLVDAGQKRAERSGKKKKTDMLKRSFRQMKGEGRDATRRGKQ